MSGIQVSFPTIQISKKEQLDEIHEATLWVLGNVGAVFDDQAALDLFAHAGAKIEGKRVKIPSKLVERSIESCPTEVTLKARNPAKSVELKPGFVHYTNGFGPPLVRDLKTGQNRPATLADLEEFIRLADHFDNVHYCIRQLSIQDIQGEAADICAAVAQFKNTDKHVHVGLQSDRYLDLAIAIGELAGSDADGPVFSFGLGPFNPLNYEGFAVRKLLKLASRKIPMQIGSGALAGATMPATIAGALVVQTAELLAGTALAQIAQPGTPVTWGTFTSAMNMATGKAALGGPELSLIQAGTAQVCERYGIPLSYGTGGICATPLPDIESGYEKALTILFAAVSGVSVIHDGVSGLLGDAMIASYEQMVIDNEICERVNRLLRGIVVNEETLALQCIEEVGPGGDFLAMKHTARNFRKEFHLPSVTHRLASSGDLSVERSVVEEAKEKAVEILKNHQPNRLSRRTEKKMDELLERL